MPIPSLDEDRLLIQEYHASSLSSLEFASTKGMSEERLYCSERRVKRAEMSHTSSFVEIKPLPEDPGHLSLDCAGVHLGIPSQFNHQTMARFLRALLDVAS